MLVTHRGLGSVPTLNTDTELLSYCGGGWLNYLTASGCWNHPMSYWKAGGLPQPTSPAPPSDALTNPTGAYDPNSTVGQDLSNSAWDTTLQSIRDFFSGVSTSSDSGGCTILSIPCSWMLVIGGIGLAAVLLIGGGPDIVVETRGRRR